MSREFKRVWVKKHKTKRRKGKADVKPEIKVMSLTEQINIIGKREWMWMGQTERGELKQVRWIWKTARGPGVSHTHTETHWNKHITIPESQRCCNRGSCFLSFFNSSIWDSILIAVASGTNKRCCTEPNWQRILYFYYASCFSIIKKPHQVVCLTCAAVFFGFSLLCSIGNVFYLYDEYALRYVKMFIVLYDQHVKSRHM